MTPEEITQLQDRVQKLESIISNLAYSDRYISQRTFEFLDSKNMIFGHQVGTKIGTEASQKIAFYGKTPVIQASSISQPSGGLTVDSPARTAINSILTALSNIGIIA